MGYAGSKSMSVVSSSNRFCYCGQILPNHEQMGMASTCVIEDY